MVSSIRRFTFRVLSYADYDFCPWANRYVFWLKEPVGWFVLATLASILVGTFVSPLGWTLAVGLVAVLGLGLGFPWLATRCVTCTLRPVCGELHERENSFFELSVRSRLPLPIMGLMIEGYLQQSAPTDALRKSEEQNAAPDIGLARVPAFCTATYRLPFAVEYRGRYPVRSPKLACSFPFSIWTARREIRRVHPVTVLPLLIPIDEDLEFTGKLLSDRGAGQRASSQGDFLGVRDFRRGDSLKSIHWVQSAKQDNLIVCERGGPQSQAVDLRLSTVRCQGTEAEARENLAWRVRIVASLVDVLSARHLPFRLFVDGRQLPLAEGVAGGRQAWKRLAEIPHILPTEGTRPTPQSRDAGPASGSSCFMVTAEDSSGAALPAAFVRLRQSVPTQGRAKQQDVMGIIDLDQDIALQLNRFIMEAYRERANA